MNKKEYLNEEKYQKNKKKILYFGIGIIVVGVVLSAIIFISISCIFKSTDDLEKQSAELKITLQNRYNNLKEQGFIESSDYKEAEGYEMELIDIALRPDLNKCESSSEYADNDTTREYCKVKAELYKINYRRNNPMLSAAPSIMILMTSIGVGIVLILFSKQREMSAYSAQSNMPIDQEKAEKMAPSIGKVAKEITKNVKEELKDEKK